MRIKKNDNLEDNDKTMRIKKDSVEDHEIDDF